MRAGLVVGAGGTPGGFFIRAAFAALHEHTGWRAEQAVSIVGTSAGAINTAHLPHLAEPPSPEHLVALASLGTKLAMPDRDIADRIVPTLRRLGGRALAALGPAGRHEPGYEVADGPFHPGLRVVSVQRRAGGRRVARLHEADEPRAELYASAAVPGFAQPVEIDGAAFIDGAVHSPTNADLISPVDHDLLIVIAPMVPLDGGSLVQRSHRALLIDELQPWRQADKPVVVVTPSAEELAAREDHEAFGEAARRRIAEASA